MSKKETKDLANEENIKKTAKSTSIKEKEVTSTTKKVTKKIKEEETKNAKIVEETPTPANVKKTRGRPKKVEEDVSKKGEKNEVEPRADKKVAKKANTTKINDSDSKKTKSVAKSKASATSTSKKVSDKPTKKKSTVAKPKTKKEIEKKLETLETAKNKESYTAKTDVKVNALTETIVKKTSSKTSTKANTSKTKKKAETARKDNKTKKAKTSSSNSKTKKVAKKATKKKNKITIKNAKTINLNNSIAKRNVRLLEYFDLPYRYNETTVKILAQTPKMLFVYWDISDHDREQYTLNYGENFFNETYPVLLVKDETSGQTEEVAINDFANSWYLHISNPRHKYSVELGRKYKEVFKTDNVPSYVYIKTSNDIEIPNDHVLLNELKPLVKYKNAKTNEITFKNITNVIKDGKIVDFYSLYQFLYNVEDINNFFNETIDNPTSGSTSSRFK